jgi:hypothetical protein
MYRFVARRRSASFLAFYLSMQFLANVTIACGLAVGAMQWLLSRRFRRIYDTSSTQMAGPTMQVSAR